jgi:hypothetical protein
MKMKIINNKKKAIKVFEVGISVRIRNSKSDWRLRIDSKWDDWRNERSVDHRYGSL